MRMSNTKCQLAFSSLLARPITDRNIDFTQWFCGERCCLAASLHVLPCTCGFALGIILPQSTIKNNSNETQIASRCESKAE